MTELEKGYYDLRSRYTEPDGSVTVDYETCWVNDMKHWIDIRRRTTKQLEERNCKDIDVTIKRDIY